MQLIGNLKKQVDDIDSKEGKKEAIMKAGMMLTDDELEMVAGAGERVGPVTGLDQNVDSSGNPILKI